MCSKNAPGSSKQRPIQSKCWSRGISFKLFEAPLGAVLGLVPRTPLCPVNSWIVGHTEVGWPGQTGSEREVATKRQTPRTLYGPRDVRTYSGNCERCSSEGSFRTRPSSFECAVPFCRGRSNRHQCLAEWPRRRICFGHTAASGTQWSRQPAATEAKHGHLARPARSRPVPSTSLRHAWPPNTIWVTTPSRALHAFFPKGGYNERAAAAMMTHPAYLRAGPGSHDLPGVRH